MATSYTVLSGQVFFFLLVSAMLLEKKKSPNDPDSSTAPQPRT